MVRAVLIYSKVFLLEVKWESEETLAASKLYSFLGKINSKIEGTLGIFISYNELKENFIKAFRNGIRQNCILIHGEENIEHIIDKKVDIKDFLEYCFVLASTKNRADISTSEFIVLPDKSKYISREIETSQSNWLEIYKKLTETVPQSDFAVALDDLYSRELNLSEKSVNVYNTLNLNHSVQEKLEILIVKLVENEKDEFTSVIVAKFKNGHWKRFAHERFCEVLQESNLSIEQVDRELITENVLQVLGSDWELENKACYVLDIYYDQLTVNERKKLIIKFLNIYCDKNREERFKQKQFSNKLFSSFENGYFSIVKDKLIDTISEIKQSTSIYENDAALLRKYTFDRFESTYEKVFKDNDQDIKLFFNQEYSNSASEKRFA